MVNTLASYSESPGFKISAQRPAILTIYRSQSSLVNIVSGYGLDGRVIQVRSLAEAKAFPCILCVQTSSEVDPASYTVGTGGPFLRGKAQSGRDADHSPHLMPRS
jgi:hypothetical protein